MHNAGGRRPPRRWCQGDAAARTRPDLRIGPPLPARIESIIVVTFASILERTNNPVAPSILLVLAWIAASDGQMAGEELATLRELAEASQSQAMLDEVIELACRGGVDDLHHACIVLKHLPLEQRRLCLQMAIGMALADSFLTIGEGHILRLLTDVVSIPQHELEKAFKDVTGAPLPQPGDPSSLEWWRSRERRSQRHPPHSSTNRPDVQRLKDLACLGLDEGASEQEIKAAYRRMAKVHHPDRFMSLGPEAVKMAEATFRRIQAAYERLVEP